MKKIAVVGVPGGWSSETLADAVEQRTGFRLLVDMAHVRLDMATGSMWFQGQDLTALDAVIVKKIAASYSPDVLDRLEMLRCLEGAGVRVFSRPGSILRLIDRLSCTVSLRLAGMPMPATTVTEDVAEACATVAAYGRAVFKPLYSSKARGMVVLGDDDTGDGDDGSGGDELSVCEAVAAFKAAGNPVMYIQQFVAHAGRDLGVTFLGGRYLATYARQGSGASWNTTTRSGGRYVAVEPAAEIVELARKAQEPFGLDFTCVDVVETPDGPLIYEVSAFGGFRGLLDACGIDAAARYVNFVLEQIA